MGKPRDPVLAAKWRARIHRWRESGKGPTEWCREQNINYDQFYYWKIRILGKKQKSTSTVRQFVELVDQPTVSIPVIEYQGFRIEVGPTIDESALIRCLQIVRRVVC